MTEYGKVFGVFKAESRRSISLALPIILGQIGQVSLGLVDTAMVGRVGIVPLAGVAFGSNLLLLLMVVGSNLCTSVHVLVSRSTGDSRQKETSDVLQGGLIVGFLYSFLLAVVLHWQIGVMDYFGQPEDVVEQAKPYTIYTLWSLVPFMLFMCFRNYSEAWNHPWPGFVVTIIGILANIFLNWIFIFGEWGAPAMGAAGAGFATLLARILMLIMIAIYVFASPRFIFKWRIKEFVLWKLAYIKSILTIGLPIAFQGLFGLGFLFASTVMMGWLGAKYLAAHQIALNYCGIIFMIPLGLSFALSIRVGNAMGMNDPKKARNVAYSGVTLAGLIMAFFAVCTIATRHYIPLGFVDDFDVITITSQLLLIVAFFQIIDGMDITGLGSLKGFADVKVPAVMVVVTHWIFGLAVAYLMGFVFDYKGVGVWLGLMTASTSCGILICLRLRKICKHHILSNTSNASSTI